MCRGDCAQGELVVDEGRELGVERLPAIRTHEIEYFLEGQVWKPSPEEAHKIGKRKLTSDGKEVGLVETAANHFLQRVQLRWIVVGKHEGSEEQVDGALVQSSLDEVHKPLVHGHGAVSLYINQEAVALLLDAKPLAAKKRYYQRFAKHTVVENTSPG